MSANFEERAAILGYTPSNYQEDIFNFILHGNGNAVISAKAGSGKTTTCVAAIKMINPRNTIMFLAFNKSVADELTNKLSDHQNVTVRTSHGLGYSIIRSNLRRDLTVDEYKYRTYLKNNVDDLSNGVSKSLDAGDRIDYIDNICALTDFARFNLAQTSREVHNLAEKYDVPLVKDECDVTVRLLEWGKTSLGSVDYTDMIWLPNELSMRATPYQKDFIFIDECQDQSIASIRLFMKCFKGGSRFIAIGDPQQTINVFAGASEEAFGTMVNYPKTKVFDLPICYRCPRKVIAVAKKLVPEIQLYDKAPEGTVMDECETNMLTDGDMVLCRYKAPLLRVYAKLLRRGAQCYIKGNELGNGLKRLVEEVDANEINLNMEADGVFVRLYDKLFEMRNNMMETRGLDYKDATLSSCVTERYDLLGALEVLAEGCNTKKELLGHIDNIFHDGQNGIVLSTIHKAKGLEADNVYILCNSSMPSPIAKKEWEKDAEHNLTYVAYTRAKKKLGFISEKEIRPHGLAQGVDKLLKELCELERKVCEVLGKTPIEQDYIIPTETKPRVIQTELGQRGDDGRTRLNVKIL